MKRINISTFYIIVSAALWGITGVLTRFLGDFGFETSEIIVFRMAGAAVVLLIFMSIKNRSCFRIQLKNLLLLIGMGAISLFGTSFFYLRAVKMASLSVAAILMYTAPFFVMIASAVLFKEKMNRNKIIALFSAFLGCVLISGFDGGSSMIGIVCGLMSGITYASYTILGKYALKRCDTYTTTLWAFIFAGMISLFMIEPSETMQKIQYAGPVAWILIASIGLLCSVLPYLFYTKGLETVPAGKASIMTTVEPMVATICGIILFQEVPQTLAVIGIMCIVFAILLVNNFGRLE